MDVLIRLSFWGALSLLCCICCGPLAADEKRPAAETLSPEQQIRRNAEAFVTAFNQGDAERVAEFWTPEGEYVDETGQRFVGREAIRNEYKKLFATNPGAKLTLAIDFIRLLKDDVALEDGRASVSPAPGPPAQSRYLAVHVKTGDQWFLSSVRDSRVEVPSTFARLADLEFLVGSWSAEHRGVAVELDCRWIENKSFLERTYKVTDNAHPLGSHKEIVGWDPQARQIKSWSFSSDGGHAVGTWTPHERGWLVASAGVHGDGTPVSAVYVYSVVDHNVLAWKSLRRTRGGVPLPETHETLLKRQLPAK